ncbi:putative collagen alpha-3(VI) chain, partial [Apostichopus japonicus]
MPVTIGEKCSNNRIPGLRWFYDPSTDKCSKFIYHGCGGNQNKFLSQKRCQRVCSASCYDEMRKLWIANGLKKPSLCGECVCNSGVWACPSYSTC